MIKSAKKPKSDDNTIVATNQGPVDQLVIPCPQGRIVELRGTNDLGKSVTLANIDKAIRGEGKIDVRRGCVSGSIEGLGMTVRFGRSTTRTGELAVEAMDGKLKLSDIIAPGLKEQGPANAKVIKAILQVRGLEPDVTLFYDLLGGQAGFEAVVSEEATKADDVVVMAARIKADCEKAARKLEELAEHETRHATEAMGQASGVDLETDNHPTALQAAYESAVREKTRLDEQELAALRGQKAKQAAQAALDKAIADSKALTLDDAIADEQTCLAVTETGKANCDSLRSQIADLQAKLVEAVSSFQLARTEYAHAIERRKNAESAAANIDKWRQQVAAACPDAPSEEAVTKAAQAVSEARQRIEQGAIVRRAKEAKARADVHLRKVSELTKQATSLRQSGKQTDEVLSELIAGCGVPLRVEGGVVMTDTDNGPAPFLERSHGTRSRMAFQVAVESMRRDDRRGVFILDQEYWEGLAPARKQELVELVAGTDLTVYTARATDDQKIVPVVLGEIEAT